MRRRSALLAAVAVISLAGCTQAPNAPGVARDAYVNETIAVSAAPEAIRGLESDLRTALETRRDSGAASLSFNESGGPPARTTDADASILTGAFGDAQRKAAVLAKSVHASLGPPIAVDEVNAADPMPRYAAIASKGVALSASRVTLAGEGPEIVRVTFALVRHEPGPGSITVYGLQAVAPRTGVQPATQLSIQVSASGNDALKTVASWEEFVRQAAHRRGVRDADIRVGNLNMNLPARRP